MGKVIAATVLTVVFFSACDSAGTDASVSEPLTIGVVLLDSEYFDRGVAEIRSLAEAEGHSVIVEQSNKTGSQDAAVDSMIQDGVDVLVVTAHATSSSTSRGWVTEAERSWTPYSPTESAFCTTIPTT